MWRKASNQCGGALVEYTVLLLLVVIVLLAPMGAKATDPSALDQIMTVLKNLYAGFSYAISISL